MRFFKTNAGESVLQWSNGMAITRTQGEEVLDMLVLAESEEMNQQERAEFEDFTQQTVRRFRDSLERVAKPGPSTLKITTAACKHCGRPGTEHTQYRVLDGDPLNLLRCGALTESGPNSQPTWHEYQP